MEYTDQQLLAVAVVISDQAKDHVLLRRRPKQPDKGKWEIFAGYVNPGERLEETIHRVVTKKAGITSIDEIRFSGYYYDEPNRHEGKQCIPLLFSAFVNKSDVKKIKSYGLKWFEKNELQDAVFALDNKNMLIDLGFINDKDEPIPARHTKTH